MYKPNNKQASIDNIIRVISTLFAKFKCHQVKGKQNKPQLSIPLKPNNLSTAVEENAAILRRVYFPNEYERTKSPLTVPNNIILKKSPIK